MHGKKIITLAAVAATIAMGMWVFMLNPNDAARVGDVGRPTGATALAQTGMDGSDDSARSKRREAEEAAARKLVADFDSYVARIISGDDSLDGPQRMEMAYRLERAVEYSPSLRAALQRRLRDAFKNNEITAMMELERGFMGCDTCVAALMDVYATEIERGGQMDYYALQNASYFQGSISDQTREKLVQSAFAQLEKYSGQMQYNGAMLFLSSAARSGVPIPQQDRERAIGLIQGKLYAASEGDGQYFAAQNLYKLMSAQDAARQATAVLSQRPTFSIAHATLEAIVHGRMTGDPALIQSLTQVAGGQGLTRDQSATLHELLARVVSTGGAAASGS
jgi:hypothetical protein